MWEYGILIPKVKDRAIDWIDNKRGLELFAEAGASTLKKREVVLQQLKEKLNSPMPAKKKIKAIPRTIFELGDIIALQINKDLIKPETFDWWIKGYYINNGKRLPEIDKYKGYYVVVKKIYDDNNPYKSDSIVYPYFILYDYLYNKLPDANDLKKMKILDEESFMIFEKTKFHWKKRKCQILGNGLSDCREIIKQTETIAKRNHLLPWTYLNKDFDAFVLHRFLLKGIIKK